MTMKANLAIWISALVSASFATADIVEEETWYSAEGKVVKTVKRTLTGTEARNFQSPVWEPAWVIRERERRSRGYLAVRPAFGYFRRGYQSPGSYPRAMRYFLPGYPGGLVGDFRGGRGGRSWGWGPCRPGLSLIITR